MCGICGEIRFDGSQPSIESVTRMNRVMFPRGPDGSGVFQSGSLAVGHQRLKILDLTEHAQQPMIDSELGLGIVFNGCIYNFRDLRVQLQGLGYRFFSEGDTEVILKAYAAWGIECVDRFHGMFAFAIWERDSGRLVLARDRLGIKPLYYTELANGLRFASTLARAARDRLDRHRYRPGRAASLHELPRGGSGTAYDSQRGPQVAAGDGPGNRCRRAQP